MIGESKLASPCGSHGVARLTAVGHAEMKVGIVSESEKISMLAYPIVIRMG